MADKEINAKIEVTDKGRTSLSRGVKVTGDAAELLRQAAESPRRIELQRTDTTSTDDQALWTAIRNRTEAIGFKPYKEFIDRVLCSGRAPQPEVDAVRSRWHRPINPAGMHYGVDAYELLKVATEAFLILECGVAVTPPKDRATGQVAPSNESIPNEATRSVEPRSYQEAQTALDGYLVQLLGQRILPYMDRIVGAMQTNAVDSPFCNGILQDRLAPCLLELIWSFWNEEGLLVQTMNALSLRFQNKRGAGEHDPLAHLNLDPLRPMSNLIWGYIQDEIHRLSVARRVYEYDHHYGLTLVGKAVPTLRSADSRSKFLEAFHNLLYVTSRFYREDDDTTVIADAFAVLNALREVHLILAQGAHNQFGDLPWTARVEMLIQQWLLARPEFREFLSRPAMVPYKEDWMATVDTMKQLQGWSDVTVTHFRDLAVYGEQILLGIRYGDWIGVNDAQQARNWARYWRPEVQSYMHSYRAVTGVDLTAELTDTRQTAERYVQPSIHHFRRLELQRGQPATEPSPVVAARRNGGFPAPARAPRPA